MSDAVTIAAGYPLRIRSFLGSAGIHCFVILFLGVFSSPEELIEKKLYIEPDRQPQRKVIYYNIPKKLPDVSPQNNVADSPEPRGREEAKHAVIATAPNAKSNQQLIWLPAPKVETRQDLLLPDLIAKLKTRLPAPPIAPPETKPMPEPASIADAGQASKRPRAFVPPAPVARPRLPMDVPLIETPDVGAPSTASPLPVGAGIAALPSPALPSAAPPAPVANPGNAPLEAAIANKQPREADAIELPGGARPGEFSKAPNKDAVAKGGTGGAAITVPDLSIRKADVKSPDVPDRPQSVSVLYSERVRSVPLSTLSVPLRPNSRAIPRAVDTQFRGRNVYTMVVPIENLPAYEGDWILWFAERDQIVGGTAVVRAPTPFRKFETLEQAIPVEHAGQRVQFAATIEIDGKLRGIKVLTPLGPVLQKAVIRDLTSWEFRPATRNGAPMEVEAVIEISFSMPPAVSRSVKP